MAQVLIGPLRTRGNPTTENPSPWLNHVMQIYALFMLLGTFFTFLIPETKRKTLEELSGEEPSAEEGLRMGRARGSYVTRHEGENGGGNVGKRGNNA